MRQGITVVAVSAVLCLSCQQDPLEPAPNPSGNLAPEARIRSNVTSTIEGGFVDLDARGSLDPEGAGLSFHWDFGDGSTDSAAVLVHQFVDDGDYVIRLTVTDPQSRADTATHTVLIHNAAPHIEAISLTVPPMPASSPVSALASVSVSDPGLHDNVTVMVDWGDGAVTTETKHTYTVAGVYSISVTAADKDGAVATRTVDQRIWIYDRDDSPGTAPGYEAVDLNALNGHGPSVPMSINNRGEVVGWSMVGDGLSHAFLWKDGVMVDIGSSVAGATRASVINDDGWIGGDVARHRGHDLALWRGSLVTTAPTGTSEDNLTTAVALGSAGEVLLNIAGHEFGSAALWRDGRLNPLGGFLPVGYATAHDMNGQGQIVGASAFRYLGGMRYAYYAFLWHDGVMRELQNLGYPCAEAQPQPDELECGHSSARAINDRGQIVGDARALNGLSRAVLWENAERTPQDLQFGTGTSRAVAINERGQVAGEGENEGFFRDTDGSVTNLGSLGGGETRVVDMNEAGVVVGTSRTVSGETHPFAWTREGGMIDLNAGPFAAPGVGAVVTDINDRGEVIGFAGPCHNTEYDRCDMQYLVRGVLWRPILASTARR